MAEDQLMYYTKRLMTLAGTWQLPQFKSPIRQKLYHFLGYMFQIFGLVACLGMSLDLYFTLRSKNIRELAENLMVTASSVLTGTKIYIYQNSTFNRIIKAIIKDERKISNSDDEGIRNLHRTSAKYVSTFSNVVTVACFSTAIFICFSTFILGLLMSNDPVVEKPVIIRVYLPFDQNKHYGWSLLFQMFCLLQVSTYFCACQSLYISLMTFVKLRFLILQHQIRSLNHSDQETKVPSDDMDMMKRLIRSHQILIRFVTELNESIKFLILAEFLISSSLIATAAFQFIAGRNMRDYGLSIGCVIVIIQQLFIFVWHADAISVESVNIANAFYNSQWYDKIIELQKMVYMAILRAQKPLTITIGPFKPLTNPIMAQVINAAYSFITLMTRN